MIVEIGGEIHPVNQWAPYMKELLHEVFNIKVKTFKDQIHAIVYRKAVPNILPYLLKYPRFFKTVTIFDPLPKDVEQFSMKKEEVTSNRYFKFQDPTKLDSPTFTIYQSVYEEKVQFIHQFAGACFNNDKSLMRMMQYRSL